MLKSSLNNQYIKVTATGGTITNGSDGYATKIIGKTIVTNITYTTNINLATKFTTDSRGEICIYNLLMNSGSAAIRYHLEEVENPNYGYIINTTTHNNYRVVFDGNAPSGWVTLPRVVSQQTKNINSTQRLSTIVKNVQSYIALSGTVWEDIYSGKNNQGDNKYTEGIDALVKGIKVYLYKNGRVVATRITDENGYYKFEYDGLKFTTVKSDWNYTVPNGAGSKTAEVPSGRSDRKDRNSVNEDFTEITNNTARNSSGTKTYNLEYNFANHRSTFIEHWKYKYSQNKNKKKILQVTYNYDNQNDYEIIGSTKQSGFNLKQLWDKSYQNTGNESIDNINHGIIKREQPDMALSSDIDYVNVIVNGYENTYQYGGRKTYTTQNENSSNYNAELDGFDVGVKFGNKYSTSFSNRGLTTYTRPIYESDLSLYNKGYETNKDLMQIYVTYKIVLTNQSTKLYGKISELKNYHDSRYTIVDSWINNNTNNKVTWVDNGKYGNTYKDEDYMAVYTQSIKNIEIAPNGSVAIYIKFKINSDTVKGLMHKQPTLDNITEITSYSTGTKTNGNWQKYAGVDEDSNPETAKIQWTTKTVQKDENGYQKEVRELNKTTYEDDTDVAPSLILDFSKENPTRGLSGTVFEDKTKENTEAGKTRLGDGKYTVGENTIYNAKVELLEANDDGTIIYETDEEGKSTPKVATLYSLEISKDGGIRKVTTKEIPAITYTNKDGNYVFNGIVPDRYLIRYTYDNNCYIMKPNTTYSYVKDEEKGILQSDMKFENGMRISYKTTDTSGRIVDKELLPINIVNYKSTIIGSPKIKQALQQISGSHQMTRMGNLNWIVEYEKNGENIIRYSDAVDDTVIRDKLDSDGYYGNHEEIEMYMNADTAVFDIGVEYSKVTDYKSWTDYRDEFEFKNEIIVVKNGRLVRQPTFYAINPYQDNLPYVKALPGMVYAEIDNELIQGATLELEYTITIINDSELDYEYRYNKNTNKNKKTTAEYYYYGTNNEQAKEISAQIRKVVDYMESDLVYDTEKNKDVWKVVVADDLKNYSEDGVEKRLIADNVAEDLKEGYTISITEYFYNKNIPIGGKLSTNIYASKLLSTKADGISAKNHAEIIQIYGGRNILNSTPGNYDPVTEQKNEQDNSMTSLVINPPTGLKDNIIIYIVAGGIGLVILAVGVYIIRKKVIN